MNDFIDLDPILLRPQAPENVSFVRLLWNALTSISCANVPKSEMVSAGDISQWQGEMDWNMFFDNGMEVAIIRAMINGQADAQYDRNVNILSDQKRLFLVYGATGYPTLSNAIPYARALADLVKGVGHLAIWWDAEAAGLLNPYEMSLYTSEVLGELSVLLPGDILEIYTRQSFWDSSVQAGNWQKYPLAAARYNTSLTCPWSDNQFIFRDWSIWRWWQDSQWWDGKKFGAKSTYIDHDYFNGNLVMLKDTYKVTPPIPPVTDPELVKRVEDLESKMVVVNTRLDAIETKLDEIVEPPEQKTTLTVEITEKHKAHYYKTTDNACQPDTGKPIMLTVDDKAPLEVSQRFECNRTLKLSCKDDENTPVTRASGYNDDTLVNVFYRIAEGSYTGKFIRADKSVPWE